MTLETGFILTILNTSKWVTGKLLSFSSWKNLRMRLRYLTNILKLRSLLIHYRFKRMATEALVNCIIKLWLFYQKWMNFIEWNCYCYDCRQLLVKLLHSGQFSWHCLYKKKHWRVLPSIKIEGQVSTWGLRGEEGGGGGLKIPQSSL